MEYRSKHPMDVLKWIEKVIDSCKTYQQLLVADKLLDRCFMDMYITKKEKYGSPVFDEWRKLSWKSTYKMSELTDPKEYEN
jgi:hypothetical protein